MRDWHEVQAELQEINRNRKSEDKVHVHVGRLFPILVEKNFELDQDDPLRKFKGRVVFDGSYVRDQDRDVALFQELSSCPATMQAGKAADCHGCLPGRAWGREDMDQIAGGSLAGSLARKVHRPCVPSAFGLIWTS